MKVESSLVDLYKSTVEAFPYTTKRQHLIDEVDITELLWTPFVGIKTLFIRGIAENIVSKKIYKPMILFKSVKYHSIKNQNTVEIVDDNKKHYLFEKLNQVENEVLLRCGCKDFYWRGVYSDFLDHSLYGRNRKKYESLGIRNSVNPTNAPMICKHLIKLAVSLNEIGILI